MMTNPDTSYGLTLAPGEEIIDVVKRLNLYMGAFFIPRPRMVTVS